MIAMFTYLAFSLASANDARMFRVAAYAIVAFASVWFSEHIGTAFNMPKWIGLAMGGFLFGFPVLIFLLFVVAQLLTSCVSGLDVT